MAEAITDFLFPIEHVDYTPSSDHLNAEIRRLHTELPSEKQCPNCKKTFSKTCNLNRHVRLGKCVKKKYEYTCQKCKRNFRDKFNEDRHVQWRKVRTVHKMWWRKVRWYLVARCKMVRFDSEGNFRDEDRPGFRSKSQVLLAQDAVQNQIYEAFFKINSSMETFCSNSSGWVLEEVLSFEMFVFRYSPLGGNCGDLDIPQELADKRALITVTGRPINSKDCFVWAVIAAIHHNREEHCGAVHWSTFKEVRPLYRLPDSMSEGDTVTLDKIADFEKKNRVSVNVFAYDCSIFPLRVSNSNSERGHANLLLLHALGEDETLRPFQHYCAVKDLGRLIYVQNDGNHRLHVCPRCLNHKYTASDLAKHMEHCKLLEPLRVRMPESKFVEFKKHHLQLEAPFVIVARFECFRRPILDHSEPTEGSIVRERLHEPYAFAYYRLSVDDSHPSEPVFFVDDNPDTVMREFFSCMQREASDALAIMRAVKPIQYCDVGFNNIEASNEKCHICDSPFIPGQRVVLDHDHVSGKIRGRACNACNLNFRAPNRLIVVLDDLSEYDGRILRSAAEIYGASKIQVVPKTIDSYAGLTINGCRFVDLKKFFKDPLECLIDGLRAEEGEDAFAHARKNWPIGTTPEQLRRIPLCRDYIMGPEELHAFHLPPLEAFTDSIADVALSPSEYQVAVRAWNDMEEKCLKYYLRLTLICDCLSVADIISQFRKVVMKYLKLDPIRFYTLASFAWESALRFSGTTLELQTPLDAHLMIENAIREAE